MARRYIDGKTSPLPFAPGAFCSRSRDSLGQPKRQLISEAATPRCRNTVIPLRGIGELSETCHTRLGGIPVNPERGTTGLPRCGIAETDNFPD